MHGHAWRTMGHGGFGRFRLRRLLSSGMVWGHGCQIMSILWWCSREPFDIFAVLIRSLNCKRRRCSTVGTEQTTVLHQTGRTSLLVHAAPYFDVAIPVRSAPIPTRQRAACFRSILLRRSARVGPGPSYLHKVGRNKDSKLNGFLNRVAVKECAVSITVDGEVLWTDRVSSSSLVLL